MDNRSTLTIADIQAKYRLKRSDREKRNKQLLAMKPESEPHPEGLKSWEQIYADSLPAKPYHYSPPCIDNLEYRMKCVGYLNGIYFVNDSRSVSLANVAVAIEHHPRRNVVLILQESDVETDISIIAKYIGNQVASVVLFGASEGYYSKVLGHHATFKPSLYLATQQAYSLASQYPGVVLFSPGCSSLQTFGSFMNRGLAFNQCLQQLEITLDI